jgi:hypothetical protein
MPSKGMLSILALSKFKFRSKSKQFRFGISSNGYRALRKILQLCPFDTMPGVKQRYFFAGSYGKIPGSSEFRTDVRVEQNREGKKVEVRVVSSQRHSSKPTMKSWPSKGPLTCCETNQEFRKSILNEQSDSPMIFVDEIQELQSFEGLNIPRTCFSFFREAGEEAE